MAFSNSSFVKEPDLYNLFKEFNCSTKLLFFESVVIEFDSTNKFVGFIISKRSVEPLHFSTQIDVAINILYYYM